MKLQVVQIQCQETLKTIAEKFNVSEEILKQFNKVEKLQIGDRLLVPIDVKYMHVVKPMETLQSISKTYQTTPEKIKDDNKISSAIFIGQQLLIL